MRSITSACIILIILIYLSVGFNQSLMYLITKYARMALRAHTNFKYYSNKKYCEWKRLQFEIVEEAREKKTKQQTSVGKCIFSATVWDTLIVVVFIMFCHMLYCKESEYLCVRMFACVAIGICFVQFFKTIAQNCDNYH